ncbi:FtsK/SpoIIIE domain-containing protein [Nonomuraea sp. NPDC049784]|uniref:FtsK/SpoIIIE domain-containing protein n=1 Tax=Nonomuraea sp. NPDC049784 TaxID=3154361 RepID=UPI0033ECFF59
MRIMLTVLGGQGDRDVVIEGDDVATVAAVSETLSDHGPLAKVVRLPRSRAPYGMSAPDDTSTRVPHPRMPARADVPANSRAVPASPRAGVSANHPGAAPVLWRDGRPLDPRAPAVAVLRDGDKVTLEPQLARTTVVEEPGGVAEVRVVGGPAAGTVHRLGLGVHVIGSDPMCAMSTADPAMAPEAVTVRVTPEAITVERAWRLPGEAPKLKLKGRWAEEVAELTARVAEREAAELAADYGEVPELDGRPLTERVEWPDQAVLNCGSSVFVLTSIEPKDAHLAPRSEGGVSYNRPPRLRRPEPERKFVKPKEPSRNEGLRLQLLAALLPAVLGLTLAFALKQPYYLLVALMTPVIMIGQWWSDRRHGKKQHKKAIKEYNEQLQEYDEAVERARAADEAARRQDAPDPAQVLLTATGPRRRLWERRIHDSDSLRLRVGLADLPANLELSEEQGGPIDPPICRSVPVALPMRRLGVAGVTGPRTEATSLVSWLIAQAATLHSPRDLAIVVVSAHADGERRWGWMRWLPHCAPRAGEECVALVGTDPESAARRVSELAALIDERQNTSIPELGKIPTGWDDLGGPEKSTFSSYDVRPYDVLVILDGAQVLRGLPNMPQVLRQGPRSGVFTLAIDDDQRLLPEECQTVAACGNDGLVRLRGGGLDVIGPILADLVSPTWCDRLARALSPIRDVSRDDLSGNLPDAVRLLDLMGLPDPSGRELAAKWHDRGSTQALIGVGPEGPFSVDLRLDGPHGLIAGTTGAGKSELLQTLICALAVANRPDQLTFVLIDYKGGAAFKECVRLPHTVGMVSDLDGHLTQRALDSLAAEIRRRERLLRDAGAKDIEDYTGPAMPRLLLIIDEFAALVAELPDFVAGLVDIARRGRSLGIHLILATQRPAGVVTADIQANTSLRIALRVTEPAESADVIDLPDAAHISKSTPGRCYVRSGVGAATAVQTARVGGRSPAPPAHSSGPFANIRVLEVSWRTLGKPLPPPPEPEEDSTATDLTLVADALIEATRLAAVPIQPSPWLDPLPTQFVLDLPALDPPGSPALSAPGTTSPNQPQAAAPHDPIQALGKGSGQPALGVPRHPSLRHPAHLPAPTQDRLASTSPAHHSPHSPGNAGGPTSGSAGPSASGGSDRSVSGGVGRSASESAGGPASRGLGGPASGSTDRPGPGSTGRPASGSIDRPASGGWEHPSAGGREGSLVGGARRPFPAGPEHPHAPSCSGAFVEVAPVPFGLTDRPWAQDRHPLALDLAHGGHLLIAGAARSGRSTALRTIAGSIAAHTSPGDVHIHAVDCGSGALLPLVAMPHCGAVVTRDQLDRVERLLTRLRAEVGRRQQLLAEAGHASLAEYRQAGHRLPWLVFMLDRWEGFVAAFEGYDYGRLIESVLQLLREGPAVGLRAVVTSDRSGLLGQVSTVFDDRLLLRLSDPADYGLAGFPLKGLPSSIPPGRALSIGEHGIVEHHIALLSPDPSGPAQVAALQSLSRAAATPPTSRTTGSGGSGHFDGSGGLSPAHERSVAAGRGGWHWEGEPPLRVDALPMRITVSQALALDTAFTPPSPLWALVGAGGDALAPLGLDLLAHGPGAVIAGPSRSGRSSVLLTAAHSLIAQGTPVIAVAPRRSPLRELEGALAVLDGNATNLPELVADRQQYVVLVDDAELINADGPLGMALEEVLRSGRDGDHGLLIAGATGDLAVAYRGFVAETRKSRTGVLLAVQNQADGDIFSIRLPRGTVGGPPGRGFLVRTGTITPIQAALPDND